MGGAEQPRAVLTSGPPLPWLARWPGLLLLLVLVLAYRVSEGNVAALFSAEAREFMASFARGFWPPAHSAEFLSMMARPLVETVAIAVVGMSLALVLAFPLSYLAASPELVATDGDRPSWLRRGAHGLARVTLNLMRSIPELIWALLFVRMLGIGPAAGVLAIGVGYAGVIGKVFAEIFESTPRGPATGLSAAGAPPLRAFSFAVLPTAAPMMVSYGLYRFDCALRSSAILGLVGAGGLGMQLELSLKMFAHDEVATQVLVLFALVAGVDQASQWVRRRLQKSTGLFPVGRRALWLRAAGASGWAGLVAAGVWFLDLPLGELLSMESLESSAAFVASLFPPDLDPAFLAGIGPAVLETLALSVLGTAIAAVGGFLLAWPAARRVFVEEAGFKPGRLGRVALTAGAWLARALLNLGRTLPEVLWALVFIFAVGLGPFAGALALGVHTAGVLGRLYSEALEEVPTGPLAALRAAGAPNFRATLFAVLPQAMPQLVAYTLYRWEVNIRASAVLGVVGAGGLGQALFLSLGLFQTHRTLTLVTVVVLLVGAVDVFSGWLRRASVRPRGTRSELRTEVGGAIEAVLGARRLLVLDLSPSGGQVFARPGELSSGVGEEVHLELDLGHQKLVPVRARVAWRKDHVAGSYVGLAFRRYSALATFRLRWRLARLPKREARRAPPAADAW